MGLLNADVIKYADIFSMVPVLSVTWAYMPSLLSASQGLHDNEQTEQPLNRGILLKALPQRWAKKWTLSFLCKDLSKPWTLLSTALWCTEYKKRYNQWHLLNDGLSICNVSKYHALDDGVVFFLRKVLVGHQRCAELGGWRRIHSLQPCMALNFLQWGTPLGVPLQHPIYQTVRGKKITFTMTDQRMQSYFS